MTGLFIDFLKVSAAFFMVLAVWVGFQSFVRKHTPCGKDRDVLEFMLGGCGRCANRGTCEFYAKRQRHYESL